MSNIEVNDKNDITKIEKLYEALSIKFDNHITKHEILMLFTRSGIALDDTRIKGMVEALNKYKNDERIEINRFRQIAKGDLNFILRCINQKLVIPDFASFCVDIKEIYDITKSDTSGQVATYIPQLMRVNPEQYGVAICTVDGQRFSVGDANTYFCVQSGCKPINYCIIQEDFGEEFVHRYIGKEPSGHGFNNISLNSQNLPHNPLINSGGIMACAILKNNLDNADRFVYVMSIWDALSGHTVPPRFNSAVYLSEKNTADRNYALGYFIKEKNVFPPNTNLSDILVFYFQCCSIELTANTFSIVAGTLANAGVCAITNETIFSPNTVKNCLSMMSSCGMYDFSGEFVFTIGLPAKSGVSGVLYLVVPNLMGICIWSPRLDAIGNSVRGINFCKELVKRFNFHIFDSLIRVSEKKDPRYKGR